jgi:hypothetical protein
VEAEKRAIDRQSTLAPFLEHLEGEPPLHPSIVLDRWERSALDDALIANGNGKKYGPLLIEGVAWQSKYYSELDELESKEFTTAEVLEKSRECLVVNAAIGMALMDEMQRMIDSMVLSGAMGEAKKLTGYRNKLHQIVQEIKERVGAEAYVEAKELSRELVAPLEKTKRAASTATPIDIESDEAYAVKPGKLAEKEEGPPKQIKLDRYKKLRMAMPVEERPSHFKKLFAVFGVSLVAWLILVLPGVMRTPLPELSVPELPSLEAVLEVDARPPSLYVVVSANRWNGMAADRRLQWVEQIGQTASASGYTGIHVRTDEGAAVAQWLKEKGARLVKTSGSGS